MKNTITIFLILYVTLFISYSCQNEESFTPDMSKINFSFSQKSQRNGRTSETVSPKFVLIGIKGSNGIKQENIRLPLYAFGQSYLSESLELKAGSYELIQFTVVDSSDKVIYATPLEGSEMAKYVNDPLPIGFKVSNEDSKVNLQVLSVDENDEPETWGYESFGFEIANTYRVKQLLMDGIKVQDTLNFSYADGKVSSVNWCTSRLDDTSCLNGYTELRHYNEQGKLDVISGRWHVFYFYENGLRKRIMTYRDSLYFSSTNLEYSGTIPTKIKVHFAASNINEASIIDLTFNSSGDLVHKTVKDKEGILLEDDQIEFTQIKNPLQSLKETISYAIDSSDFNDVIFYYSKHAPKTIVNAATNSTDHPVTQHSIQYQYKQDDSGKLVSAKAFYNNINVHNIFISYE